MRIPKNYYVRTTATGIIVLILLSLPLFWARWFCKSLLGITMPMDFRTVDITPSGLFPFEIEADPNVIQHSMVHAYTIYPEAPLTLVIANYFADKAPEGRYSDIFYFEADDEGWEWVYLDKKTGQLNCRWPDAEKLPDGILIKRKIQLYAGPEGVSEIPDNKLGRFTSVVAHLFESGPVPLILYDRNLRRFFAINLLDRKVTKGPQLSKDDPHQPVDIGILSKNPSILDLCWMPPNIKTTENNQAKTLYRSRGFNIPIRENDPDYQPDRYILVLDKSGQIDLLDKETLEFAGPAGHLPAPETLFPSDKNITTDDLLAYRVLPMALKEDHKYRGLFAAAVSREGTSLALDVFDEKGALIESDQTGVRDNRGRRSTSSSRIVLFGFPWAPAMTIGKFLLENLQPPILSVASYFTASSFEAGSGHRALLLLPNSFVAMKGRDVSGNIAERFLIAIFLILPSIILGILLAVRVVRDANVVGFSKNIRVFWMIATVAFGLAGYITYRLTRPKVTLVTCANCGKPRRPDMEKCHRCGSKWDVPELIPPAWRVLDR